MISTGATKESGEMEGTKEWLTLRETVALIKPEHNGYPMEEADAVEWLLNLLLSDVVIQSGETPLLPSYIFVEPVEIWTNYGRGETDMFSGLVDIWIEGATPRNMQGLPPGFIALEPTTHCTSRKRGDCKINLHHHVSSKPNEYPKIRLVYEKSIRESEIVISLDTLSRYASEWGLDEVLASIEQFDFDDPESVKERRTDRLSRCIERVNVLRKTGLSDKDIICRLYDTGEYKAWAVLGQAIDLDPNRELSLAAWHKKGIRTAEREGMNKSQMSKSDLSVFCQ
jgi:hypothetical protein